MAKQKFTRPKQTKFCLRKEDEEGTGTKSAKRKETFLLLGHTHTHTQRTQTQAIGEEENEEDKVFALFTQLICTVIKSLWLGSLWWAKTKTAKRKKWLKELGKRRKGKREEKVYAHTHSFFPCTTCLVLTWMQVFKHKQLKLKGEKLITITNGA